MKKQTFSFSKNFISGCTTIKDFGWCKSEVWIDSLDKKKKQEILDLVKKALDGKIEFKNTHYIPSREYEGITYTKYTGFKWSDSKKYPGLLGCTANRLTIIGNTFVVEKEHTFIDPTFKVKCLLEESEARKYIMSRFNKFLDIIKFKKDK